jgi:excisionase family DNA binding protein
MGEQDTERWRERLRGQTLRSALRKRSEGVPTYSVPEAATLLSISQEYLYRLIQAGGFPAVRMRIGARQGRYVVPAKAIEQLLDNVAVVGECVDVGEWSRQWQASRAGGVA